MKIVFWVIFIWLGVVVFIRFVAPYIVFFLLKRLQKKMIKDVSKAFEAFSETANYSNSNYYENPNQYYYNSVKRNKIEENNSIKGEYIDFEDIPNSKKE